MRAFLVMTVVGWTALAIAVGLVPVLLVDGPGASLVLSVLQHAVLIALAALAGSSLAPIANLRSHIAGIGPRWCGPEIGAALLIGVAVATLDVVAVVAAMPSMDPSARPPAYAALWPLALAAFSVCDEILWRWGALSVVLSVVLAIRRRHGPAVLGERVFAAVIVAAMVIVAYAVRDGSDRMWVAQALTAGLPALAYGWLCARWSLEAAMIAHVVQHLLAASALAGGLAMAGSVAG